MTRLFGSSGITNQPTGLDIGVGGSSIKSIQRGSVAISSTSVINVPITSVDLTKSIVLFTHQVPTSTTDVSNTFVTAELTTSTNIAFTRGGTGNGGTIKWEVIEYNNVKSVQSGSYLSTLASETKTITSVNTSKSTSILS